MNDNRKEFVMRCIIDNVSKMTETTENVISEEHFNIPWEMTSSLCDEKLNIFLYCMLPNSEKENQEWSIDAVLELNLISANGNVMITRGNRCFGISSITRMTFGWGWHDFIGYDKLMKYYVVDDKVTLEARVKITKMSGFGKGILKKFDESVKDVADIVLVVKDQRFYLSKLFLGLQSSYFKSLLLGNFGESQKSEVTLTGIDPEDFQNFLELIHGEMSIDDNTINGILHLADMYDSSTAIRRCEEFLLEKSMKSLKTKLQMSTRYNLTILKNKCLSDIETVDDIRLVMPDNLDEMDSSIARALLEKSLSLH